MICQILADSVVVFHLVFILFVVLGGILVVFQPRIIWIHIPCVVWGIIIELTGGVCPLTPLENYLRTKAGQPVYTNDFVIHYIEPIVYPANLTRELQIIFSLVVILVNAAAYGCFFVVRRRKR
jgi:hypothetical protein